MATPSSGVDGIPAALNPDPQINAVLVGSKWASSALTYSFVNAGSSFSTSLAYGYGPSSDVTSEPWTPYVSYFGASQQTAAVSALAKWSAVANITFSQVPDLQNSCGDIRFGFTDVGDAQAEAFSPSIGAGGDVWFSYTERSKSFAEGSYNYLTMVHEIGHAIGLKHSFEAAQANPAVLPASLDTQSYTVMSYSAQPGNTGSDFSYRPTTPMVLDIQAIQYLYGANMNHNAGNTAYQFSQGANYHQTIWDGGGRDTISYDGSDGCVIDLREGTGSLVGNPVYVLDLSGRRLGSVSNVWIAKGAAIENASGGGGADRLIGNGLANDIFGGAGNDTLSGGAGNDRIDGGAGTDLVAFSGPGADYTVTYNAATGRYAVGDHNRAREGTDVISAVESFQFSDGTRSVSQLAITAPVTGDARTVLAISEGFFGMGPGQQQYAAALNVIASGGASQLASVVGNSFAATETATLTSAVLGHFGLSADTLGGGDPDAAFAALQGALTAVFGQFPDARGQVVLNIGNLLTGLESDPVYGQAAAALQNMIAADWTTLAATLVGVTPADTAVSLV